MGQGRDHAPRFGYPGEIEHSADDTGLGTAIGQHLAPGVDHEAVAEAAVIGVDHELKGQAPVGFVILRGGFEPSDALADDLRKHVGTLIGGLARPEAVHFTPELPKTRSGKIMRRLLRDVAEGKAIGDTTTLADPGVLDGLRADYEQSEG